MYVQGRLRPRPSVSVSGRRSPGRRPRRLRRLCLVAAFAIVLPDCDRSSAPGLRASASASAVSSAIPAKTAAPTATTSASASPARSSAPATTACEPLAPGAIRFVDVAPHTAARFVALVKHASVVAVGRPQPGSACEKGCRSLDVKGTAEEALRAIGFETKRAGSFLLASSVASEGVLASGGREVDLDLERAACPEVLRLLGDVSRLEIEGAPSSLVTVVVRNEKSLRVLGAVASAIGGKLEIGGKRARLGPLPALPEIAGIAEEPCKGERLRVVVHECRDVASLRVVALGRSAEGIEALVTASDEGTARVVRVGDSIGQPHVVSANGTESMQWREVVKIACDGLHLDYATRVPLADGSRR